MTTENTRWKQRFSNFKKSYLVLERVLNEYRLDRSKEVSRMAMVQAYEMAFELGWKTLKDYLQFEGFSINSPREAIKEGFKNALLEDGETWIRMLDDRNATTHLYDEKTTEHILKAIETKYVCALEKFGRFFEGRL